MAAIYDYLPTFAEFEPNNLKGLQPGFVLAQVEVKEDCTLIKEAGPTGMERKFLENGHIMTITTDGMDIWAADKPMFISYSEPIHKLFKANKFYATDLGEESARFVQLIPGDEWMSTIDYMSDSRYTAIAEELKKHIIKIENSEGGLVKDDWFDNGTMPSGAKGYHYMYIG